MNAQTVNKECNEDKMSKLDILIIGIILYAPFIIYSQVLGITEIGDRFIYLCMIIHFIIVSTWFYILYKYGMERIEQVFHLSTP